MPESRLFAELDAQTYDDTLFVPNVGIDMEDECRCYGCGAYTVNPVLHVNPDSGDYECGEQYAERDRYGDPVEEPQPDRNDPEYVAWCKSWLAYWRQLLTKKP